MIREEKKWLSECIEAFNSLRQLCMDFDDNFVGDAYLERKITILFPIFKKIDNFVVQIGYQQKNIKDLYMFIFFSKDDSEEILKWFNDSYFEGYSICQKSDVVGINYCFIDIINCIEQNQINKIREELEGANETSNLW